MSALLLLLLAVEQPTTLLVPPFSHTLGFQRVGGFYIRMYLGSDFRIDDPQGMCGAKMTEEDDPSTGRDDHILTMFAVNSGTGQVVYNVRLLRPGLYGSAGSDTGQFKNPHGICCDVDGDVYVADTDNDRVVRLKYAEGRLGWVSAIDSGLSGPMDVGLDSRGNVYVTDAGNDRVMVFDENGAVRFEWQPGLEQPSGIAVLDRHADYNEYGTNHVIVIDRQGTRVNKLDFSGQLVARCDMRRIGLAEAGFAYCAFDIHGNVYVTDSLNNQVHMFDPGLQYIVSYGRTDEFDSPRGIAIWRRFGQVFVNEAAGGQYYWVGLDGYLIGCYPQQFDSRKPGTTIALYLTEVADVEVTISGPGGGKIRTLTPPHHQKPGEALIVWDGRDDDGELVPPGDYRVNVEIRPTYSKPKYTFKKELVGSVTRLPDPG